MNDLFMPKPMQVNIDDRISLHYQLLIGIFETLKGASQFDGALQTVADQIKGMVGVEAVLVDLFDRTVHNFCCAAASCDAPPATSISGDQWFPIDSGVPGYIVQTGQRYIFPDGSNPLPDIIANDPMIQMEIKNLVAIPISLNNEKLGVLIAANRDRGAFDENDLVFFDGLTTMLALWIEKNRMNLDLKRLSKKVERFDLARNRVIQRFSHELKTPLAVVIACLKLLGKRLVPKMENELGSIYQRAQRNIERLLDMEYALEDILREQDGSNRELNGYGYTEERKQPKRSGS